MTQKKVIVIGGGAAGLSAAYELRKRGLSVLLLEASDRAGGRMAGEVINDFHVDTGAQLLSTSYTVALRLCEELDVRFDRSPPAVVSSIYNSRKKKVGVVDPSTVVNRSNARTLLTFALFSPTAILQLLRFAKMMRKRKDDFNSGDAQRLLDLDFEGTFAEWCRKNVGEEFLEQFCDFVVATTTLSNSERISPLAGMMLMWLALFDRQHTLHMPEQGMGYFARRLAQACEDVTRLSTPVERVVIEDGSARGVVTKRDGLLEADAVICATPAPDALKLIPGLPDGTRDFLADIRYSSTCHVVFGVDHHPLPRGHYFFMFQRKGDSFLDCFLDSTVGSPLSAPEGKGIVHAYPSEESSRDMFGLDDEEIKRRVIDEIRRYAPTMPEEPLFTRVYRWENAVCLPYGGMMRRLQSLRAGDFPGIRGLFLAGEYLHNLPNVNGALTSGTEAADKAERHVRAAAAETAS